jgi:hypothetical protein
LEYNVRNCLLLDLKGDAPGDPGNGEGFHLGRSGGVSLGWVIFGMSCSFFGGEAVARGSREGLFGATAGRFGALLDKRMPSKARLKEASRWDMMRFT